MSGKLLDKSMQYQSLKKLENVKQKSKYKAKQSGKITGITQIKEQRDEL